MSAPADRFSRLEKVAIFLIALGEERTREILDDVDRAHLHIAQRLTIGEAEARWGLHEALPGLQLPHRAQPAPCPAAKVDLSEIIDR